jgi:hypothetical protein
VQVAVLSCVTNQNLFSRTLGQAGQRRIIKSHFGALPSAPCNTAILPAPTIYYCSFFLFILSDVCSWNNTIKRHKQHHTPSAFRKVNRSVRIEHAACMGKEKLAEQLTLRMPVEK